MTTTTPARTRPATDTRPQNRADTTGPGRRPRTRNTEAATRARAAAQLAATGIPYTQISERLGYATAASAHRAATRAAATLATNRATDTRALILPILDRIRAAAFEEMHTDRPRMYRGRPILLDPDDPDSVIIDPWPKLRAVDRALKVMDQEAKLLGLYPSHPGPRISRVHPLR